MPSIGASGILGAAIETISGTYLAPTKFFPIDSESLNYAEDQKQRRPIRNTPGLVGIAAGNSHIEGDITMDATPEVVLHFLRASRYNIVKTGTAPANIYTCTPAPIAVANKTMSIAVKRGNEVFGYTGCVVTGWSFSLDDAGEFKVTFNIVGNAESTQSALTPTWPTAIPFNLGDFTIESPTGTPITDTSSFEFSAENGGEAQYRIKSGSKSASFVKFGEESATISVTRDFETRAEYDAYKALTARSITFKATKSGTPVEAVEIVAPVAIADSYEISLGSQADLVAASISYQCVIDASGNPYQVIIKTAEVVTI